MVFLWGRKPPWLARKGCFLPPQAPILPSQNKNYYAKIQGLAASELLRCRDIFFVEMLWTGLYRLWMQLISETGKNSDTELAMTL